MFVECLLLREHQLLPLKLLLVVVLVHLQIFLAEALSLCLQLSLW